MLYIGAVDPERRPTCSGQQGHGRQLDAALQTADVVAVASQRVGFGDDEQVTRFGSGLQAVVAEVRSSNLAP